MTRSGSAAVLGLALLALGSGTAAAGQVSEGRTLVVPFEAAGDPRASWLGEGVAMLLADGLSASGADAIARDERVRAFDRLQVPMQGSLTRGTVIRIGQMLGAATVVTGTVRLEGRELSVDVRALRIDSGRVSAEFREQGSLESLPDVVSRAARRLVPGSPAVDEPGVRPPLAAFEQLVRGLLAEAPAAEIAHFEKALSLAPEFDRARLALSRAHADTADWKSARQHALMIPPASPFGDRAAFEAAVAEIHLGRHDEAFERLKALGARTSAPEIVNNLGVIQLRRGADARAGRATYFFNQAVEADPAAADYAFNLGYAYWRDQDHPAAVYWLREAVRRQPGDGDAHFVLAAALDRTGAPTEAARERELARRLSAVYEEQASSQAPGAVPGNLERLRPRLDPPGARRTDSALLATEQRGQRELVTFHLERGRRFFERENDSDALAELGRAIYLSPYQAEAHLLVGRLHLRAGRLAEAIAAFKIALWSEATAAGHVALGEAYRQAKDLDAARQEAERALAITPGFKDAEALLERLR